MTNNETINAVVRETMTPRIDYHARELSPFFHDVFGDSSTVVRPDWGRGWIVKKLFRTGLAGAFQFANMDRGVAHLSTEGYVDNSAPGTNLDDAGVTPQFNIYGHAAAAGWPGPDQAVSPGFFNWDIPLIKGLGVLYIPAELRRVDATAAAVGDRLGANVDGTAENVAFNVCNAFFADQHILGSGSREVPGVLCTIRADEFAATGSNWINNTAEVDLALSSGSIRRMEDGMRVDLFYMNTNTLTRITAANAPVFVNRTDDLGDQISLINVTGSTIAIAPTGATLIYVVPHGTYTSATYDLSGSTNPTAFIPFGLDRVYKDTGELYGTGTAGTGISLATHRKFKSYVVSVGGALDEQLLMQYTARWQHARSPMYAVDKFVCSEGVFVGYTDGLDGFYSYERNGKPLRLEQGVEQVNGAELVFEAFGRMYALKTDPFIGKGKLYGTVTRNHNWKKHVPPRLVNTATNKVFDQGVEFVVPLLNSGNDIFQGAKATSTSYNNLALGQTTDLLEAPFYYPYQIVPDILPGMKLTDITESYGPLG